MFGTVLNINNALQARSAMKGNGQSSWLTNTFNPKKSDQTFQAFQADLDRQFNAEQAELSRVFNAQQAQLQRDFEERLANSAYQRAVSDMKSAGLNPYLAYSQGGAVTPTGATASAQTASHNGSYMTGSNSSILSSSAGIVNSAITAISNIAKAVILKK